MRSRLPGSDVPRRKKKGGLLEKSPPFYTA